MYIHRNRPAYTYEELTQIYAAPHRHDLWQDHVHRVDQTIRFARKHGILGKVADLSCGDATIASAVSASSVFPASPILGDFAPGYDHQGPIDETISKIPFVDVYVCTETLEHLDNPMGTLWKIREKTRTLLLSTPVHNDGDVDENPEHYWTWDREGVEVFINAGGFVPFAYEEVYSGMGYRYGVWGCVWDTQRSHRWCSSSNMSLSGSLLYFRPDLCCMKSGRVTAVSMS